MHYKNVLLMVQSPPTTRPHPSLFFPTLLSLFDYLCTHPSLPPPLPSLLLPTLLHYQSPSPPPLLPTPSPPIPPFHSSDPSPHLTCIMHCLSLQGQLNAGLHEQVAEVVEEVCAVVA